MIRAAALLLFTLSAFGQDGRFVRLHWFEPGPEHGNFTPSARFRVNAPETSLHPEFGKRSEARSSGMMQIRFEEDLTQLSGAELYAELWGGHPGTGNKRVTLNGRSTYTLAEVGTASGHCTHQYPTVPLKITDLVEGYNAVQWACDKGKTFWGHFIVDNACLRAVLKRTHPDLAKAGLSGFRAEVVSAAEDNGYAVELKTTAPELVSSVHFSASYLGYDENGDGDELDVHGFTKKRIPVGHLGTATQAPFRVKWDTTMLAGQSLPWVSAIVEFRGQPGLIYETERVKAERPLMPGMGIASATTSAGPRKVSLHYCEDLPAPFWSRAGKRVGCAIRLAVDPATLEAAELHVVIWDGDAGNVKEYFTLNGKPLEVAGAAQHDVVYSRIRLDPSILRNGENRIEVLSDTEHHGIEILKPGPAIAIRRK